MNEPNPLPDLADQFRRLLTVVTGALCAERRWGWLGGPMALLAWLRERRERREAAAMLEAFKGFIEQFLALLEEHRAGKLGADDAPQVGEAPVGAEGMCACPVAEHHDHEAGADGDSRAPWGRVEWWRDAENLRDSLTSPDLFAPKGGEEKSQRREVESFGFTTESGAEAGVAKDGNLGLADRWIPAPGSSPRTCVHKAGIAGTLRPFRRKPMTSPLRDRIGYARPLFSDGVWPRGENCVHFVASS